MEPAKIDWKTVDSVFVVDDLYEHIKAPKWVDFSAPDKSVDDEAWFCRPDCKHPKTVEDFLNWTPSPPSKLQRSTSVSEIHPLCERKNTRDANLKRRGVPAQPLNSTKCDKIVEEDGENQNPNLSSVLAASHQYNSMKSVIKSSTEKKKKKKQQIDDSSLQKEQQRPQQLKSTLSARNLFGGRNILNQITEFCTCELKRLATRAKERENVKVSSSSPVDNSVSGDDGMGELNEREKERKPLLEAIDKSNTKEKLRRKKRVEQTENTPIALDLKNVKCKDADSLLQIRTCPPSPQCFSAGKATRSPLKAAASKSRLQERGVLQELVLKGTELRKEEPVDQSSDQGTTAAIVVEQEAARTLDVFWFLKPCTLSS